MDYYVDSAAGNDDWSGTEAQPWRTLAKAGKTLMAGDTVYVMAGEYSGDVRVRNSGQPGLPITFKAAQGQSPVINSGLRGFDMDYVDHIVTDGFEIMGLTRHKNDEGTAIAGLNSRFCTVRNCYLHDNPRHGVMTYGGEGWLIEDCRIHDNGGHGLRLFKSRMGLVPEGIVVQRCEVNGNGFQIGSKNDGSGIFIGDAGNHCQIEDNVCNRNGGNGILIGGTCNHNTITHNQCYDNVWYGIWASAATTETVVENNTICWNDCRGNSGGIALSWSRSNYVYRNIVAYCAQDPTRIGGGLIFRRSQGDKVWNNIIWANEFTNSAAAVQIGAWWEGDHEPCNGLVLLNNIVGGNESKRNLQCSVEPGSSLAWEDHNDWYGKVNGFEPGPHSINADPLLQDDFHLAVGSPCIGAGVADMGVFQSQFDMGVYPSGQGGCSQVAKTLWKGLVCQVASR